jgi:hypothetical protein
MSPRVEKNDMGYYRYTFVRRPHLNLNFFHLNKFPTGNMSNPPMDPPPFDQPMIRKCIKTNVRIQSHEALQEVLILTTVLCPVDSQRNPNSSFSRSHNSQDSASSGDGISSSDEDMYSETSEDCSGDENDAVNNPSRAAPQSQDEERYKMKAFWLRKDPICEVRLYY